MDIPTSSGIYKITCIANKKIYIGSAVHLRYRKSEHFNSLRQNRHINQYLQRAWNKYGEQAFIFEVLELVLPISLTAREQYWFNKLKPFNKRGFNIAREAGSKLGTKHSALTRKKQSLARIGMKFSPEHVANMSRVRKGKSAYNKGLPASESVKRSVSLAHRKLTVEQFNEIRSLIDQGQLSQAAISRIFGVSPAVITRIKQGYSYYTE